MLVLCEGWAAHFLNLSNAGRQILGFSLPGDLLTPTAVMKDEIEYPLIALTDVQLSVCSRPAMAEAFARDAGLQRIISSAMADKLDETRLLLAAVARGSAEQRIAFLALSLARRIKTGNIVREDRYLFPLLQQHLADALGLTPVHVSRVMASFRARGWMRLCDGVLEISNRPELERLGLF